MKIKIIVAGIILVFNAIAGPALTIIVVVVLTRLLHLIAERPIRGLCRLREWLNAPAAHGPRIHASDRRRARPASAPGFGPCASDFRTSPRPTPLDILGLARSATRHEIRAAYRHMAFASHPDRGGDPAKFRLVKQAYKEACDMISTQSEGK